MTLDAPTITLADLSRRYGRMPATRVRLDRYPATEDDVLELHIREKRLYELKDGILLEKTMGLQESFIAMLIGRILGNFVDERDLGIVTGEGGMMRLDLGLVRIPDVAFISWDQYPDRKVPSTPIPDLFPDLAIEVISISNTIEEIEVKLDDYFEAGTSLAWIVYPKTQSVRVYSSRKRSKVLTVKDTLDGGKLLPGFELPLHRIFSKLKTSDPQ